MLITEAAAVTLTAVAADMEEEAMATPEVEDTAVEVEIMAEVVVTACLT